MPDTRMPTQKRSIAKRNKIIEKGFELMCEKGYYKTSTTDIAKYCDISIGIIYQYFNDKKEIFMEGVKNYYFAIMYPMLNILETEKFEMNNQNQLVNAVIDKFIESHTISKRAHEELLAMSYLDENVANIFKESELLIADKIISLLNNNGFKSINIKEKVHIIIGIVDNFCHEVVYHKHKEIDYDVMKDEIINIIINILK